MKTFLHLKDGTALEVDNIGWSGETVGEVVFSTGMVGYPESMTDPSFAGQILVFTYPLIGNYGIPAPQKLDDHLLAHFESERIWVKAIVTSSVTTTPSHHTLDKTLVEWCKAQQIPILTGVDTRALTQKIREHGVLMGKISSDHKKPHADIFNDVFPFQSVSITAVIKYKPERPNGKNIGLIDCGVKHGILRALLDRGYAVTRIPYDVNPLELDESFDGIVVSNGPGDPKDWGKTVEHIGKIIQKQIPLIGICLGHQLVALAIGADTYKLKYGHRGINQPVQDMLTQKCYLTSQNHGYAVKTNTIPKGFESWFVNLNDGTNEGLKSEKQKIWTTQFHPEGSPGPFDTQWMFELLQ